jgi:hypothetical protein
MGYPLKPFGSQTISGFGCILITKEGNMDMKKTKLDQKIELVSMVIVMIAVLAVVFFCPAF